MPDATQAPPAGADDEGRHDWREAEARALAQRRTQAYGAEAAAAQQWWPRVGLALSGGGIRSATFCLGLLRGFAQNGILKRFDYLSTVSGGGFVGAMFGRLVARLGIAEAERTLAGGRKLLLWWVRSNGRYLTPAGSRDLGMALVTYFRAWCAVQLEFAVASALVALVIVAPHVLQNTWHLLSWEEWPAGGTPWWPATVFWLALTVPGPMAAYWIVRDPPMHAMPVSPPRPGADDDDPIPPASVRPHAQVLAVLGICSLGLFVIANGAERGFPLPTWPLLAFTAAASAFFLTLFTALRLPPLRAHDRALQAARVRNLLTRELRLAIVVGLVLFALGALDLASWEALAWLESNAEDQSRWLAALVGAGGALLLVVRAFAEPLQKVGTVAGDRAWRNLAPRLLNVAGLLAALLLFFLWLIALQALVFRPPFPALEEIPSWAPALGVLVLAVLWTVGTGWSADAANASSLHSFYRARLTRAWLSVGNPRRGLQPQVETELHAMRAVSPVTDVVEGDDVSLLHYRPQESGGPIHLINACLNQSRDDRSGLYNADRKGLLLTVSADHFEVGPQRVERYPAGYHPGTLGRWTSISGAAVATGAGSYTSRGWAAMMFLLGVRLGHWIRAPLDEALPSGPWWRWFVKQAMLHAEGTATFSGLARPWWYLSDGGHFENTGVYALLRRELDFIVLADCGADAGFEFEDLQNLVRKARIDFDADIEFYTQEQGAALLAGSPAGLASIVSPEQLLGDPYSRGVLLARITYRRSDPAHRKAGTLLVVKPNLHNALDADVLGYASSHADFPQQSTGNQFFDEAQWESYHRLGEDFGRALAPEWLQQVPGWASSAVRSSGVVAPLRPVKPPAAREAAAPAWRKTAQAAAVGTTLGLGAIGTLALAGWQAVEQVQLAAQRERDRVVAIVQKAREQQALPATPWPDAYAQLLQVRRKYPRGDALRDHIEEVIADIGATCPARPPAPASRTGFDCERWHRQLTGEGRSEGALSYWTRPASPTAPAPQVAHAPAPRPAASAPAPAVAAAPAASAPAPAAAAACQDVRLYLQVYDEPSRAAATTLLEKLAPLGVRANAIENVLATAAATGNRKPVPYRQPTLVLHDPGLQPCAAALKGVIDTHRRTVGQPGETQQRPLPAQLKPTPNVIELWLPPAASAS
ncbi:MAG: hypothetical protein K0S57_2676 [Ramlibacter sp.]|jgi:hypothetical protein|nr:hypothetical protein [Ramlibacter sp.]